MKKIRSFQIMIITCLLVSMLNLPGIKKQIPVQKKIKPTHKLNCVKNPTIKRHVKKYSSNYSLGMVRAYMAKKHMNEYLKKTNSHKNSNNLEFRLEEYGIGGYRYRYKFRTITTQKYTGLDKLNYEHIQGILKILNQKKSWENNSH